MFLEKRICSFLVLAMLGASPAQARVFNIANEKLASYFSLTGGTSGLQKSPYENESSGSPSFDSDFSTILGGEFGFLYATPVINFRFGIGIIKPAVVEAKASNGSGELYTVKSDLTGFVPKLGLELNLKQGPNFRIFGVASGGLANITLKNDYVLTAAGQTAYSGVSDHTVEAKGSATELYGGLGAEIHMTDTTTIAVEAGYRSLQFTKLTYSKDVTTFTGAQTSGGTVKDINGDSRQLNFSGILLGISFRFYL